MTCVPPAPSGAEQQTGCERYGRAKCKSTCKIDARPTVNTVVFFLLFNLLCTHTLILRLQKDHYVDRENCVYVHCRVLYVRVTSAGRCEIEKNKFSDVFIEKKTNNFYNDDASEFVPVYENIDHTYRISFHKF